MFGLHLRRMGQLFLKGREYLDPLDGIDPEIGVERKLEVEAGNGVAGLLGHDREQGRRNIRVRGRLAGQQEQLRSRDLERARSFVFFHRHVRSRPVVQEVGHVLKRVKHAQMLGLHLRSAGQLLLKRRKDLDALDGIDAEIGIERKLEIEARHGVAGLLGHDRKQRRSNRRVAEGDRIAARGFATRHSRRGNVDRRWRKVSDNRRWWHVSHWCRHPHSRAETRHEERLLLIDEPLKRPLRGFLRFQELAVQLSRLLLHALKCRQTLLRHEQRLGDRVRVGRGRIGHRGNPGCCQHGTRRPLLARQHGVRSAQWHGHPGPRRRCRRATATLGFPRGQAY